MENEQPPAIPPLHPFEHEPAPPEETKFIPDARVAMRGVGLGVVAAGLATVAAITVRKFGWFALPIVPVLGIGAVFSAWAALIHITGGEKFDDHRWV